jgi:hypothetical protein
LGSQMGGPNWGPKLGSQIGVPNWGPKLGSQIGVPNRGTPNRGPKLGSQMGVSNWGLIFIYSLLNIVVCYINSTSTQFNKCELVVVHRVILLPASWDAGKNYNNKINNNNNNKVDRAALPG